MEDVLGEWSTARLKLQIDGVDDDPENDVLVCLEKVCSFFPPASCFGCKQLVLRRDIALKIKEINETLDNIDKQKAMFRFAANVIKSTERADQRGPSISSIDVSEIFGRPKEKKELVDRLLCEGSKEQKGPCIISLVGMGGIGKTTLAQFAYNNDDVKKHFDERIWVCVSEPFDEFRIARAVIEALKSGDASNFEAIEKGLLAPLLLSYNELPSKVKRCFSYCAVFPKDYGIRKHKLIELWMAQGYLSEKGAKEMEDIGEEYFNILASRSFFQDFNKYDDGEIYKCKMHDIVHDFAQYLCSNECLAVEIHSGEELAISSFVEKKILHLLLTLRRGASVPISIWGNVTGLRGLRSLLVKSDEYSWSSEVLPQLFEKLTCLRALELQVRESWPRNNLIKEIPTNIEKLLHLKYLNLKGQKKIEKLPETLCELYNLERLNVDDCQNLRELPRGIGKLRKLMYLHNEDTGCLRYLPAGIGELIRLRRVREFVVGGGYDRACSLGSLQKLNFLQQCGIRGLGGVSDAGEAARAELEKKKYLLKLGLHFDRIRDGDEEQAGRRENEEDEDERLLEALGPPPNLKNLGIDEYRGRRNVVPKNWFMSLTNLRDLSLFWWSNCEHLPPLGKLKSLESLLIYGMQSVKRVGNELSEVRGCN
ncbi:hypothetical protein CUMW_264650 [Citrus unshiu]|uniref:Uncharacterized protein n=1 Tax=Citrus unshiu TaxID=55188 RepID=A0A2H5QV51_CITUN|nr:hypothetical protein CUMW_264650 [Citrus unshiu]